MNDLTLRAELGHDSRLPMALTKVLLKLFNMAAQEESQKRNHKPVTSVQAPASVWLVRPGVRRLLSSVQAEARFIAGGHLHLQHHLSICG